MYRIMIFFVIIFYCESIEKRDVEIPLKTSILIPCHYSHFYLLDHLLECYEKQSVVPDEVVISISQANRIHLKDIFNLKDKKHSFQIVLLTTNIRLTAGENRNKAAEAASGDLFICQDADDIPHPQRVEIIRYLFEKYNIMFLLHRFSEDFISYETNEMANWCIQKKYDRCQPGFANGEPAFLREVFQKVRWPKKLVLSEDLNFNQEVSQALGNICYLDVVLINYRMGLSSHYLNDQGIWQSKE